MPCLCSYEVIHVLRSATLILLAAMALPSHSQPMLQTPAQPRTIAWSQNACPIPEYPRAALRAEATGVTRVTVTVGLEGTVTDVRVVQRSGESEAHALLDRAAVRAMQACQFDPAAGSLPARATREFVWKIDP